MRRLLGWLLAGAMTVQLGPTTTGRAVDQINANSMRGVPVPPVPTVPRQDRVWVPDRYVYTPEHPKGLHVPGHWVLVTPEGQVIAPPRVGTAPATGAAETLPAAPWKMGGPEMAPQPPQPSERPGRARPLL